MKKNKEDVQESGRLKEVIGILVKNELIKGMTPERLRAIIEDLGPTFIKIGQIMSMRSDMIPKKYIKELEKLRSDVQPMSFKEVNQVLEESLGSPASKLFSYFEKEPLGSASIAQAHKAKLHTGERVVVKIQRLGVKDLMARDITLLKKASKILKLAGGTGDVLDFETILDELWCTTQEELDFLMEATHLETFYENNRDITYTSCPKVYRQLTTSRVLVMEHIEGIPINDVDQLLENGYDLHEIGRKLSESYVKQVMEDGLFHADPHPGNLIIRQGEIVWIDLGMMGKLTKRGGNLLLKATESMAKNDVGALKEVILSVGIRRKPINHSQLYIDIDDMMTNYGDMDYGSLDVSKFIEEIMEVAKKHQIQIPSSFSMLGRGMANLEGVLEMVSPEINYLEIAAGHLSANFLKDFDMNKFIQSTAMSMGGSWNKIIEMPILVTNILTMFMKGQTKVGMELQSSKDFHKLANKLVNNLVIGLIIAALLISSSLIATTEMKPQILDIPLLGALGYTAAAILSIWLIIDLRKE